MSQRIPRLIIDGFAYTIKDSTKSSHRYRCTLFRSKKCKATLAINIGTGAIQKSGDGHTCVSETNDTRCVLDVREEMFELAKIRSTIRLSKSAKELWREIDEEISEKYARLEKPICKARKDKLVNFISNQRRDIGVADVYRVLETEDHATVGEDDRRPFLLFNFSFARNNPKNEEFQMCRILLWAHPDLMPILRRRKIACFLDGTFRCVPQPFRQCMILMAYDDETELYIPIIFSLLQNSDDWSYWHFLHLCLIATDLKLDPSTITTDFEKPLLKAVNDQFPEATRVGCLFHFMQALRRKLVKLHVPADQIYRAMGKEMLESLTRTKKDDIPYAINRIRRAIDEGEEKEKWDKFYAYFQKTWVKGYGVEAWNISEMIGKNVEIQNRTNNALECFNRELNTKFSSPRPNIFHFVNVIRSISKSKCSEVQSIRAGKGKKPKRRRLELDIIE